MATRHGNQYICKYCKHRFAAGNVLRYLSHLRHHEKYIIPYWYSNPRLPPKAGCVQIRRRMTTHNPETQSTTVMKTLTKCQYYDKYFTQVNHKKQHEMTHTGNKPHKCQYCDKCFSRTGHKKQHEMTHTGDKPHKCQYCDKYFSEA